MIYFLMIFSAWVVCGSTKFAFNTLANGRAGAVKLIGYGGFPSTHTTVVTTVLAYNAAMWGFEEPSVGALLALLWIVVCDALSLRRKVGEHAVHLNKLGNHDVQHRERVGHKKLDIIGGLALGAAIGYGFSRLAPFI